MAATVLTGTTSGGNVVWYNYSGGNIRVIVNYFGAPTPSPSSSSYGIRLSITSPGGTSGVINTFQASNAIAVGKNLLPSSSVVRTGSTDEAIPLEFYLLPGDPSPALPDKISSFQLSRLTGSTEFAYNILILDEVPIASYNFPIIF